MKMEGRAERDKRGCEKEKTTSDSSRADFWLSSSTSRSDAAGRKAQAQTHKIRKRKKNRRDSKEGKSDEQVIQNQESESLGNQEERVNEYSLSPLSVVCVR